MEKSTMPGVWGLWRGPSAGMEAGMGCLPNSLLPWLLDENHKLSSP